MNSWLAQTVERLELAKNNHANKEYIEALETILRLYKKVPLTKEEIFSQSVWQTLIRISEYYDGKLILSKAARILVAAGLYQNRKTAYPSITSAVNYHKAQLCRISPGIYKLANSVTKRG